MSSRDIILSVISSEPETTKSSVSDNMQVKESLCKVSTEELNWKFLGFKYSKLVVIFFEVIGYSMSTFLKTYYDKNIFKLFLKLFSRLL